MKPSDFDPDFDPYAGLPEPKFWHRGWFWWFALFAAWLVLCVAFFVSTKVMAHEAIPTAANPTGWTYGWECCSAMDCEQVKQSSIGETPDGYVVRRTGEVIGYADKRIKRSKDEFYHRCTPGGNADALRSICLYVPNRGF